VITSFSRKMGGNSSKDETAKVAREEGRQSAAEERTQEVWTSEEFAQKDGKTS